MKEHLQRKQQPLFHDCTHFTQEKNEKRKNEPKKKNLKKDYILWKKVQMNTINNSPNGTSVFLMGWTTERQIGNAR